MTHNFTFAAKLWLIKTFKHNVDAISNWNTKGCKIILLIYFFWHVSNLKESLPLTLIEIECKWVSKSNKLEAISLREIISTQRFQVRYSWNLQPNCQISCPQFGERRTFLLHKIIFAPPPTVFLVLEVVCVRNKAAVPGSITKAAWSGKWIRLDENCHFAARRVKGNGAARHRAMGAFHFAPTVNQKCNYTVRMFVHTRCCDHKRWMAKVHKHHRASSFCETLKVNSTHLAIECLGQHKERRPHADSIKTTPSWVVGLVGAAIEIAATNGPVANWIESFLRSADLCCTFWAAFRFGLFLEFHFFCDAISAEIGTSFWVGRWFHNVI